MQPCLTYQRNGQEGFNAAFGCQKRHQRAACITEVLQDNIPIIRLQIVYQHNHLIDLPHINAILDDGNILIGIGKFLCVGMEYLHSQGNGDIYDCICNIGIIMTDNVYINIGILEQIKQCIQNGQLNEHRQAAADHAYAVFLLKFLHFKSHALL